MTVLISLHLSCVSYFFVFHFCSFVSGIGGGATFVTGIGGGATFVTNRQT